MSSVFLRVLCGRNRRPVQLMSLEIRQPIGLFNCLFSFQLALQETQYQTADANRLHYAVAGCPRYVMAASSHRVIASHLQNHFFLFGIGHGLAKAFFLLSIVDP